MINSSARLSATATADFRVMPTNGVWPPDSPARSARRAAQADTLNNCDVPTIPTTGKPQMDTDGKDSSWTRPPELANLYALVELHIRDHGLALPIASKPQ